jgi:ketosteroid isomerase-like protein
VRDQVIAANRAFYDAFERLDAEAMERCWAPGDEPACVHPGGPWLHGAEQVMASWEAVMANTAYIEFDIEVQAVHVADPVAWVACVERIRTSSATGVAEAEVAATNVFVLGTDGWRLTLHHGSPVVRPGPR